MSYGRFEENECLILDDNELNSLSHRLQWRNKDAKNIQSLFQEAKGKRAFPSAFQTFKPEGTAFPYYRNDKKVQEKPVKESNESFDDAIDLSGIVLDAEYICKHGIPLLKMPETNTIDFRPIDLEPLDKPDELFNYDSDSNYPYSQCTPPTTD